MAITNIFVRTRPKIGGISFDSVISEGHSSPMRITENPVESGASISDHAIIEPKVLNMVVLISDSPNSISESVEDLVTAANGLIGSSTEEQLTRSQAGYRLLEELQATKEPFDVQTGLKLYENMQISNLNVTRDKATALALYANLSLREILIAESEVVELSEEDLSIGQDRTLAQSQSVKGRQQAVTVSEEKNQSWLKSLSGWIN